MGMLPRRYPEEIEEVIRDLCSKANPQRSFVLAVDGRYGVGKSTLSRYLANRLGFECFHTDDYLLGNSEWQYCDCLRETLENKLVENKPLIVEGVRVLSLLLDVNIPHDYGLRVQAQEGFSHYRAKKFFDQYEQQFKADRLVVLPDYTKQLAK